MKKIFDYRTVIAIIAIAVPIIIFVVSKKIKELSFKNIAITELISEKDITDESIKVYFDDERVYNLYSVSCVLSNSGNLPVLKSDYTNRLDIQFPDSIKILKYSFKENPESIVIYDTIIVNNKFSILPDLLNPNESIEFSFYISSPLKDLLPRCDARLVGGEIINLNMNEEIKSKTEFSNRAFVNFEGLIFWIAFIYTIFFIFVVFWAVYFQKDTGVESALGKFFVFLFLAVGLFCNIFYLFQTRF